MRALCYIGLYLLLADNVVSQDRIKYEDWWRFKDATDADLAWAREFYNNPEKLKESLMFNFTCDQFFDDWEIPFFKRKFHIADDVLRPVLMDIYKSVEHLGGEKIQHGEPRELLSDKRRLLWSIVWLGYCADEATKGFLMDITIDDTKANDYRIPAIRAYIQCADAQQMRDALMRFFIGMNGRPYKPYLQAFEVYDESESDMQKREAIVASLIVALAREENKVEFANIDKRLAARNKEYATSAQRLAMVQRMSKLPPSTFRDTDPDLKTALESFNTRTKLTSVSTNLTELMARDFTKPPEKPKEN